MLLWCDLAYLLFYAAEMAIFAAEERYSPDDVFTEHNR